MRYRCSSLRKIYMALLPTASYSFCQFPLTLAEMNVEGLKNSLGTTKKPKMFKLSLILIVRFENHRILMSKPTNRLKEDTAVLTQARDRRSRDRRKVCGKTVSVRANDERIDTGVNNCHFYN